jgi:thiamine pyrophosphate-dependent acetolactate synthase large subunit-like protein
VPILVIAPGMPTGHPSHGNGLLHEFRNQRASMEGVVQEAHRVESLAEIPVAVAQAFARMQRGRRRPEYLEVPLDLLDERAIVADVPPLALGAAAEVAPDAELARAAEALAAAKRPLIIAGGGAANASVELAAVAELLGAAVLTTTNGKGALSEDHPLSLGSGMQIAEIVEIVENSDALLAIGTEFAPADWFGGFPRLPRTVVRVDIDPAAVFANVVPSHPLVGDSAATLSRLDAALDAHGARPAGDPESVAKLKDRVRAAQARCAETWVDALSVLDAVLPADSVIAADNAMVAYNGALAMLRPQRSRAFLFPTGAGTLGYGLPAGIGAKVASPDTAVVVLQGDGGMMFVATELATAAQIGLPLPVVVFDNGGYGEIHNEMQDRNDPIHSVALSSTDFVSLAESMGCAGIRLDHPAKLGEAVSAALAADRPTVIHVLEESRASKALRP